MKKIKIMNIPILKIQKDLSFIIPTETVNLVFSKKSSNKIEVENYELTKNVFKPIFERLLETGTESFVISVFFYKKTGLQEKVYSTGVICEVSSIAIDEKEELIKIVLVGQDYIVNESGVIGFLTQDDFSIPVVSGVAMNYDESEKDYPEFIDNINEIKNLMIKVNSKALDVILDKENMQELDLNSLSQIFSFMYLEFKNLYITNNITQMMNFKSFKEQALFTINFLNFVVEDESFAQEITVEFNGIQKQIKDQEDILKKITYFKQLRMIAETKERDLVKQLNGTVDEEDVFGEDLKDIIKFVEESPVLFKKDKKVYLEFINNEFIPKHVKEKFIEELGMFVRSTSGMNMGRLKEEDMKIKQYLDLIIKIPWYKIKDTDVEIEDIYNSLSKTHFGLKEVKDKIARYLISYKMTKERSDVKSKIICLVGPPGVGKSTIAKSIATALGRDFFKVSLNGLSDENFIKGFLRTYIGAQEGIIIKNLKTIDSKNPVILLDEIDKIGHSSRGIDIGHVLLDLLDINQNKEFLDKYLDIPIDLSKCLFILSANDVEAISAPLLNRLELIELSSYLDFEKEQIAINHLKQDVYKDMGIDLFDNFISVEPNVYLELIQNYTRESGVRELRNVFENLVKGSVLLDIYNDMKKNNLEITEENKLKFIELKPSYVISKETILKVLKSPRFELNTHVKANLTKLGVVTGLAYTSIGGKALEVQARLLQDEKEDIVITGNVQKIMEESVKVAFSYLKNSSKDIISALQKQSVHIHFPSGATPKDGPSAGITIATALNSIISNIPIRQNVAMTGEIFLTGEIKPIGGLKEKSIGALNKGITEIIIPIENLKDLDFIPDEIKNKITYHPVTHFDEAWQIITKTAPPQ